MAEPERVSQQVMTSMYRRFFSVAAAAAAGLVAVTGLGLAGLGLAGGPVQAELLADSAAAPTPSGNEWWFGSWQLQQQVWPLTEGAGVTVAVLDTGVQASIPDLRGAVRPGLDLTGHDSRGEVDYDYSEDGHGTAMAVLIAGQGYGTGTVGIAPEARILPVAFPYTPGGYGEFTRSEVVEAVRFAVSHGARVIDMSFGGTGMSPTGCDPAEEDAFAYALEHNVVLVAGAGDTMLSGTGPIGPAGCPGVLAAGSSEPNGSLWPYSDQQPYVAVAAPGAHMVYVGRDERYTTIGAGTSLSAALVSGAAALILSRYPAMPWYQVDQRIIDTATAAGHPVPNDAFGFGVVDLAEAVNASAYPVSATGANPVYASFKAWLATSGGRVFVAQNGTASQNPRPATGTRPAPRAAAAAGHARQSGVMVGRIVLVAIAVAAVGAFTVLQLRARARRRRSPTRGRRRSRQVSDWRTLPPSYEDDQANGEMPFAQPEGYGPLWRYGSPPGYSRDYEPGHAPPRGLGYGRDSDSDPGYGRDSDPGYRPVYDPRVPPPWDVPDDAPHDW
jgi:subtilisin family serine protease